MVIGVQRALAIVGAQWLARFVRDPEVYIMVSISDLRRGVAQWLARFVRDPEVYIMVSISDLRRGVAQWLARFVRDEEAGGSSPLTSTIFYFIS